jgi:hypothetical protein
MYQDRPTAGTQPKVPELSAQALDELPADLLQELDQAILVADREATLVVIDRIEESAPEIAASLRNLVFNFRMGRIREILKENKREDGG